MENFIILYLTFHYNPTTIKDFYYKIFVIFWKVASDTVQCTRSIKWNFNKKSDESLSNWSDICSLWAFLKWSIASFVFARNPQFRKLHSRSRASHTFCVHAVASGQRMHRSRRTSPEHCPRDGMRIANRFSRWLTVPSSRLYMTWDVKRTTHRTDDRKRDTAVIGAHMTRELFFQIHIDVFNVLKSSEMSLYKFYEENIFLILVQWPIIYLFLNKIMLKLIIFVADSKMYHIY